MDRNLEINLKDYLDERFSAGSSGTALGVAKEDGIKAYGETYRSQKKSTVSVDTTVQNLIELTVQSGDASDVFTFYNALIEIVKL